MWFIEVRERREVEGLREMTESGGVFVISMSLASKEMVIEWVAE